MELAFTVNARIAKPIAQVFESVADPAQLSRYFTTGGARGRMQKGATVSWDFADFPGAFPVEVLDAEPNRRIVFRWAANEDAPKEGEDKAAAPAAYSTTVTITFDAVGDARTLVSISEQGWRETPAGLKASYGNCQGWSQMLCAMKAYLEHGINLREGMYK